MEQNNWEKLPTKLFCELNASPLKGSETMGATLITARKDIKSRWYGSVVSCEESRRVGCLLNPTTLQVAAGVISHLIVALNSPNKGICMPHDFDSDEIMKYAAPYLGDIIDKDLDFELSPKWEDLLSNKENMKIKF
jgi:homospermidine synthase